MFRDTFSFPQPPSDADDRCHLVRLHDDPEELSWFLLSISDSTLVVDWDAGFFELILFISFNNDPDLVSGFPSSNYIQTTSVLRLSHKYNCPELRRTALRRLSSVFPTTSPSKEEVQAAERILLPIRKDMHRFIPLCFEVDSLWLLPVTFHILAKS